MKSTKIKVLVIALAVSLLALGSLGTLAWFTAQDEVTNKFQIATSDDDADGIFSVDVWEKDEDGNIKDSITYSDIQPGDDLYKEVNIENTGYYDQYIRATVTVTGASVWQSVYGEIYWDLGNLVEDINPDFVLDRTVYNADADTMTYVYFYNGILESETVVTLFTDIEIPSELTRQQAAALVENAFNVNVKATAIQTENVGANAIEGFKTVEMYEEAGNYTIVTSAESLEAALKAEGEAYIYATVASVAIDYPVANKTIDFNGIDATITFGANATAENVTVTGIVDTDGVGYSVTTNGAFTGDLLITDCVIISSDGKGCINTAGGDVTVANCSLAQAPQTTKKTYGVRAVGHRTGNLTIENTTFTGFGSWAILVNGTNNGNLTVDGCIFNTPDGVLKTLSGGVTGDFTFTNNTMVGCLGHDGNNAKLLVSGSGTDPVVVAGTKTVSGNTLDGAEWTQD